MASWTATRGLRLVTGVSAVFYKRQLSLVLSGRPRHFLTQKPQIATSWRVFSRNATTVAGATVENERHAMKTTWSGGEQTDFPTAWLRDNCQCPKCFDPSSVQRMLTMPQLDVNANISSITIDSTTSDVAVTWEDGHLSSYTSPWLWQHRFTLEAREERKKWLPLPHKTWSNKYMQNNIPTDTYGNIVNDDKAFYRWLCHMEQTGIFLITGAPTDCGHVVDIANRVAFPRTTNYGKQFTVKAKLNPSNAAYTAAALGLHTDLPFYMYCPGVQLLHCLKQFPMKGGDNQFADGFYVAEQLQKLYPEHYKTLTTIPVEFTDIGVDYYKFHKYYTTPIINLDKEGKLVRVAYNNQVRGSVLNQPPERVHALYDAIKTYDTLMYLPENCIDMKLKDGEIICFHNYRVLHGRSAYEAMEGGERHLEGGYIDWDEMLSRRRVLQMQLKLNPE